MTLRLLASFEVLTKVDDLRKEVDLGVLPVVGSVQHQDPPVPIHGKLLGSKLDFHLETAQLVGVESKYEG